MGGLIIIAFIYVFTGIKPGLAKEFPGLGIAGLFMVLEIASFRWFPVSLLPCFPEIPAFLGVMSLFYACLGIFDIHIKKIHHLSVAGISAAVLLPCFFSFFSAGNSFFFILLILSGLFAAFCLSWLVIVFMREYNRYKEKLHSVLFTGCLLLVRCLYVIYRIQNTDQAYLRLPLIPVFFIAMYTACFLFVINRRHDEDVCITGKRNGKESIKIEELLYEAEKKEKSFLQFTHEIKTPLMLIGSYLDNYCKKKSPDKDLDIIKKNIFLLQSDILNFSYYNKPDGNQDFFNHNQKINLSKVLSERIRGFRLLAASKKIKLDSDIQDCVSMTVDPSAIDRIVNNLLDNALKYTESSGIVKAVLYSSSEHIHFSVSDTGSGIPPEEVKRVFDPFYRCKNTESSCDGTGLGMYIVSHIVKTMGGSVTVLSRDSIKMPGEKWSTVVEVVLPVNIKNARNLEAQNQSFRHKSFSCPDDGSEDFPVRLEGRDEAECPLVLLVEDNEDMRHLININLGHRYKIIGKADGLEAIKWLESGNRPDIIVSDIIMEGMDGYTLFRELKKHPDYKNIPFIYLSGVSSPADRMRSFAEGAVDFISKPVNDMRELDFRLNSLLQIIKEREKHTRNEVLQRISDVVEGRFSTEKMQNEKDIADIQQFGLTQKDIHIIEYLRKGLQNKEIGTELGLSSRTIDNHLYKIYRKTGCQNRTELLNKVYG